MSIYLSQFLVLLWKCAIINIRGRQFLKEMISVIILGAFMVVRENFEANSLDTPFYLSIAITGYARYSSMTWVSERETRQKQLQKIMGMSQSVYIIGWLTYFILNGLLITAVMTLFLVFGVFSNDQTAIREGYTWVNITILFFLYTVAVIGFTLTLSTFFDKAKTAAQATSFIQLLASMLFFLRFSQDFLTSRPLVLLSAVLPQQSFNLGVLSIAFYNPKFPLPLPDFSYSDGVIALILNAVGYITLAIYLDQVWPNQIGTNKHPLFFIRWLWHQNAPRMHESIPLIEGDQGESSAKYEQRVERNSDPIVKLDNVSKLFNGKAAVNKLTLNFYSGEIFCLLGHNGAGKSTTINLLTGMLETNDGKIDLMGMNYKDNLTEIRKNIGLCLQYNVLYDNLTIQQHLMFYAKIKGKTTQEAQPEIDKVVRQCALIGESGKLAKNLSGGNKRKLCLACALIGDSKLVFLDEPSSGLDPNSRRAIWDIMKSIKEDNRCVILTTHHLEQAQELAQRIGIMSEGKLIIVGDQWFIRKKFNVGYHLIISFARSNPQEKMKRCRQIVQSKIKQSKEDDQTAAFTLKFILPQEEIDQFAPLFAELQSQKLGQLSLKMSNLEDAFIKLGTQQAEGDGAVPDIPDLQLPNVLCSYSFSQQFKAVFIKKAILTFRSLSSLFSVVLPAIFIIAGVVVAVVAIQGTDEVLKWIRRYIMSYFMVWAFVFNTSAYCGSIVLERQKRFKYLSSVMGLRKLPYWMGNYAFDVLIFLLPLIPFFILIYVLEQAAFLREVMQYLVPLLIVFCFAFISYSYAFSFVFQKSNTAYRLFPFVNFLFFYTIPQIPQFIDRQNPVSIYVMPFISPFIAFSNAFSSKEFLGDIDTTHLQIFIGNLPVCYIGLFVQCIVFFALTLFIQNLRFDLRDKQEVDERDLREIHNQRARDNIQNNIQMPRIGEDAVLDRDSLVGNAPIVIDQLYKKYPNGYVAIKENSFTVRQKQIFGLLGPNGAGKSTTFNIVTAALPKTRGKVMILNQEVNRGIMDIFQNVGVCPQYDALYQIMTTEDHLRYFARLKGLDETQITSTIKFYQELLSLTPYAKVQSGNLSGGNKRKLCVTMAMLANPKIMFYDEPSAGVDPISRRYLWKALSLSVRNFNTSMVLTTHSMGQAESLCSRIGILIKGRFVALDSPKNLKIKYGKGFRVQTYSEKSKQANIKDLILKQFGADIAVQEIPDSNEKGLLFAIPNQAFTLSAAYNLFHNKLQKEGIIQKYHIAESTLEQVFLHLSRMQPEVVQEQYKEPWQCCCWEFGATGCMCMI